jgi:hypothetical protein
MQLADAVAWSAAFVGQLEGRGAGELEQRDDQRWDEPEGRLPPGCGGG